MRHFLENIALKIALYPVSHRKLKHMQQNKGGEHMKKVDILIRPGREEDLRALLDGFGVPGITVSHVLGYGEQRGRKEMYRGTELESRLLSKVRFEIVLKDEQVEPLVEMLVKNLSTGNIGDGKIFISDIASVIKIRTGDKEI